MSAENALARSGSYIYVVIEGTLKIALDRYGHIDIAEGQSVDAAGEFTTKGGQVTEVDNRSGHYCPSGPEAEQAARDAFDRYGLGNDWPYREVS